MEKNEGEIVKWERTASTMVVLTIVVDLLGIVAGGLTKESGELVQNLNCRCWTLRQCDHADSQYGFSD